MPLKTSGSGSTPWGCSRVMAGYPFRRVRSSTHLPGYACSKSQWLKEFSGKYRGYLRPRIVLGMVDQDHQTLRVPALLMDVTGWALFIPMIVEPAPETRSKALGVRVPIQTHACVRVSCRPQMRQLGLQTKPRLSQRRECSSMVEMQDICYFWTCLCRQAVSHSSWKGRLSVKSAWCRASRAAKCRPRPWR